ncbi:putative acetyltransferase [Anaerosolibacter carboniphilus]|uniref:Putative acetyltransferase n=1 Tax=Anaerosolibacter carboniphilus TaxID=1417629 RepID=A0A841KZJ5_9FIRM|nr:GNAT family N-acetyltransferase [Anaerosolibacter carboniphilus]MBB6215545.1 putative acetyltransferase [Anaerosolibacter carboniphilus]
MREVRKLQVEELRDFVEIQSNAYPGARTITEEDKRKLEARMIKKHTEEPTCHYHGLFQEEQLVGGMCFYDFVMNMYGKRIQVGGVGSLAVDLLHKKEKAAKDMIQYFLKYYKHKGTSMVALYPFRPDFYKQMGFGFGTKMSQYRIKPGNLPKGSKDQIVFLGQEDRETLRRCYHRVVDRIHGFMEKSDIELENLFGTTEYKIIGYKKDEEILGYMVFSFKACRADQFLMNDIYIKEMIYENREVLKSLLAFLQSQEDQIHQIVLNTQDECFHHLLMDPRNGTDNIIPHVYHESNTQGVGVMYRIVDMSGIFSELVNHNFGNQNCVVKLSINDSFFSENNKPVLVSFQNGMAEVINENTYDVEIKMDISDFSSMIMGVISFKSLYEYGLAEISNVQFLDIVNRVFLTDEKPKCITGF